MEQHPDIFIHPQKEPRFFIKDIVQRTSKEDPLFQGYAHKTVYDEASYFNAFPNHIKMCGEASVHYLYDYEEAIRNIARFVGDIRIIIIIRDPIERAISNWAYIARDFDTFEESIAKEDIRMKKGYNSFWFYKTLGLYYSQVKAYLDNFTKVKVIVYDDFVENTSKSVSNVFNFLEVDDSVKVNTEVIHNKVVNYTPKNILLKKAFQHKLLSFKLLRRKVPSNLLIYNILFRRKTRSVSARIIAKLNEFYAEDIVKLEDLLGVSLNIWRERW